jgi:broad specificity phosphatase PhoE
MTRRTTRPGLSAAQVQAILDAAGYATSQDIADAIADLVNSAPEALDTLKELADALDGDPNFAENVLAAIGEKVRKDAGVVVVSHGATASTTRPTAAIVYWVGSVEPTNAINADLWYDTTGDA